AEFDNIKADPVLGKDIFQYKTACTDYIGLDNTRPPFDKKLARQAFSLAFDRDQYIKVIAAGQASKQLSWLPDSIPGSDPNLGKDYDFNPDKAKKALADAGYPDGKGFPPVNMNFRAGTNGQRFGEWLVAEYKDTLNVDVKLNPMDSATLNK